MPSIYELSGRTRNHVNHLAGGISPDVEGELIHQLIERMHSSPRQGESLFVNANSITCCDIHMIDICDIFVIFDQTILIL